MIVANMATFPAREAVLEVVVRALAPQVDRLNLCLNEYAEVPRFLTRYPSVVPHIPASDLKDVGKFVFAVGEDDDVLLVDDDILYPPDYVPRMLALQRLQQDLPCALGVHGVIYSDFFDGRPQARVVALFHQAMDRFLVVNQLGTGTTLVKGRLMPPRAFMEGSARFVDVRFARWCRERGVALLCVPRAQGWLRELETGGTSIFGSFTRQPSSEALLETRAIQGFARLDPAVVARVARLNLRLAPTG